MTGKQILVSLSILSLLSVGLLFADDMAACKTAITAQVIAKNPKAGNVTLDQATPITQKTGEVVTNGSGSFERHSGEKEAFSFECTTVKGLVKEAHYSVLETKPLTAASADSCQAAIRDKIHSEQAGSGAVTFDTKQMDDKTKLVQGKGHVVIKGKETTFDYNCRFDTTGALQDKKYEVK